MALFKFVDLPLKHDNFCDVRWMKPWQLLVLLLLDDKTPAIGNLPKIFYISPKNGDILSLIDSQSLVPQFFPSKK
jgi:hypothetical protein